MSASLPPFETVLRDRRRSDTLVIVPVYNEMPDLPEVLRTIRLFWDGDLLAVDDGSTDGSLECLRRFPTLHVIRNMRNAGAGGVLLQGFAWALAEGYSHLITLDADGQHSPLLIRDFFTAITRRCDPADTACREHDLVWGSRYLVDREPEEAFRGRRAINREITARLVGLTGWSMTDAFCGFRAYRADALRRLALTETGYGMFLQMTVQAWRAGLTHREIPVPLLYLDSTRNFHNQFQDAAARLAYYHAVIDRELERPQA